jgi:hypothetical protein
MKTLTQAIFRGQSRKGETDYAAVYLKMKELKTRQCVYTSRDVHGTVSRITRMFPDREVTVGSYMDNVLMQHLEAHRDEINELYK